MKRGVLMRVIGLVLIVSGLVVSGYLLFRTFTLLLNQDPDAFDVCSAVFGTGCDKTLLSASSWFLRIPVAGWGVVYFGALGGFLLLAMAMGDAFRREALLGALWLGAAGVCGSIVLSAILVGGWAPFCPLCMVVHGINILLFLSLKRISGCTVGAVCAAPFHAAKALLGRDGGSRAELRWKMVGFVVVGLTSLVVYQWVQVQSERWLARSKGLFNPHKILSAYAAEPVEDVPVSADDPRQGPEDARIEVVVFTSFHCPGCREFSKAAATLTHRFPEDVAVVFKHFPLAKPCNPIVKREGGEARACETACAAEAARLQGKFWAYHDILFGTYFAPDDEGLVTVAREAGLDLARFEADRKSPEVADSVRADIDLGVRLGLTETPAVFIAGRRVRANSVAAIQVILRDILKAEE
ncbi:MAG: thioredoxin domain-containing protein [Candidatus Hydrogenedentes bacterium]|nr:thioredoxin domain-containing protein [Candidatus Hydrogenedentota bacterium]